MKEYILVEWSSSMGLPTVKILNKVVASQISAAHAKFAETRKLTSSMKVVEENAYKNLFTRFFQEL